MVDEYLEQQRARKNKPYYGMVGKLVTFRDKIRQIHAPDNSMMMVFDSPEYPAMLTKVNEDTGVANLYLLNPGEQLQATMHPGDDGDEMVITKTVGIEDNRHRDGVPNKDTNLNDGTWWWSI